MRQCPAENRVMYEKSCFTMDTVVWCEVKKIICHSRLKTQKYLVSIGLSCSGFSFYEHFNRQFPYVVFFYIQNCEISLSENILYQYFAVFLTCLGQLLL